MFQNIDNTQKTSGTPSDGPSKGLSAADPLSMIQAKTDSFDGLDPLSMFAAQEASTKQPVSVSAPVSKKQRVCIHLYFYTSILFILDKKVSENKSVWNFQMSRKKFSIVVL